MSPSPSERHTNSFFSTKAINDRQNIINEINDCLQAFFFFPWSGLNMQAHTPNDLSWKLDAFFKITYDLIYLQ